MAGEPNNQISLIPTQKEEAPSGSGSGFNGLKVGPITGLSPPQVGLGDRVLSNLFEVIINIPGDSTITVGFAKIGGFNDATSVVEIPELTHDVSIKLPGQSSPASITFERGVSKTDNVMSLWNWRTRVRNRANQPLYGTVHVNLYARENQGTSIGKKKKVFELSLKDAWPSSTSFGPFDASASIIAIHSITFESNEITFAV